MDKAIFVRFLTSAHELDLADAELKAASDHQAKAYHTFQDLKVGVIATLGRPYSTLSEDEVILNIARAIVGTEEVTPDAD